VLDTLEVPIVQAPMAGGPSTPELAAAVAGAGGLGFVAGGYRTPEGLRDAITRTRALTDRPFGVNLFAPTGAPADPAVVRAYATTCSRTRTARASPSARRASTTTRSTRSSTS